MSNPSLHPLMEMALTPFIDAAMAKPATIDPKKYFVVPKTTKNQFEYEWHTDCDCPIVCHLDYQAYSRGYSEPGGQQIDPDEPECMTLEAAYLRGVDIFYLLGPKQVEEIEGRALDAISDNSDDYPEPDTDLPAYD